MFSLHGRTFGTTDGPPPQSFTWRTTHRWGLKRHRGPDRPTDRERAAGRRASGHGSYRRLAAWGNRVSPVPPPYESRCVVHRRGLRSGEPGSAHESEASSTPKSTRYPWPSADVAQLVEHQLPKLRVAGSTPVVRFPDGISSGLAPPSMTSKRRRHARANGGANKMSRSSRTYLTKPFLPPNAWLGSASNATSSYLDAAPAFGELHADRANRVTITTTTRAHRPAEEIR